MATNSDKARAEKLFAQVKAGKTIFFKAGDSWDIMGPADVINVGATVTVTKAGGQTSQVVVTEIMAENTTRGVAYRTARFRNAPTTRPAAEPARPVYDVVQRSAVEIGGMLGKTVTKRGYCHWCGLELDRNGVCGECG